MANTRYIVAGSLIDGSGGAVRKSVFLTVKSGVITAIGPAVDLLRTDGTPIDDLSHCVILPPLVDCSVFLSRSPSLAGETPPSVAGVEMVARHIRYCHDHGVLGVAEGGAPVTFPDRYQARGMIEIRTAGSDFLRVRYSPDIEDSEAPSPRLDHAELRCMVQQRGEKKAVVVANGPQQVAEALAAGCDVIEQGYGMGEANLRRMAELGVLWIPSVLRAKNGLDGARAGGDVACRFSTRYVAPGKPIPGAEAFWKKALAEQLAQLRLARNLGVQTAVGTGAGSVGILHGESMVEEVKLLMKAGYSLDEAIRCASENGARFFGMERLGAIKVGRQATFLIARGTVSQLPRKLAYLEGIYVDGEPSPAYRKNPVRSA